VLLDAETAGTLELVPEDGGERVALPGDDLAALPGGT
jgi:hypothetical protein